MPAPCSHRAVRLVGLEAQAAQRPRDVAVAGGFLALAAHEVLSERFLRGVLVVRVTAKPQALDGRPATAAHHRRVIEFQKPALATAQAVGAHERALPLVPFVHRATNLRRDVGRVRVCGARLRGTRPIGRTELLLLELGQERVERRVEDDGQVARWIAMTHERLRALELVARLLIDRHLQPEPLRRERLHTRRWWLADRPWGRFARFIARWRGRGGGRQRQDRVRHVGPRGQPSGDELDVALAPVCRLRDEPVDVLVGEMRREHGNAAHVQPPVGDRVEQLRKPPRRARCANPLVRAVIAHAQRAHAVLVHRRVRERPIERPRIHLAEVREQ
ncbi:MAG TPA: hypothetical protein VM261_11635 [Kofleriaceae bacterium]|nr:hypothetical protein [Kofleriaceae bacterium]